MAGTESRRQRQAAAVRGTSNSNDCFLRMSAAPVVALCQVAQSPVDLARQVALALLALLALLAIPADADGVRWTVPTRPRLADIAADAAAEQLQRSARLPATLSADRLQLGQLLFNLLKNACDATAAVVGREAQIGVKIEDAAPGGVTGTRSCGRTVYFTLPREPQR